MLISFEGIEGAGKTTQIKLLEDYFLKNNKEVLLLREPGSTDIGEEIRNILLSNNNQISNNTELLLMFAARAQLIDEIIKPNKDKVILIDRYFHASIAYQGFGRGIDLEKIDHLIAVTECIEPIREGYLTIAAQYDYMYVIPSAQSSDEIHAEIVNIIEHS